MNEKINGLWDKAVTLVEQEPDGDWSLDACKDKFAELLLKEAMLVCRTEWVSDSSAQKYGNQCADSIKQHFGVEL
jgi:hypothetical protein